MVTWQAVNVSGYSGCRYWLVVGGDARPSVTSLTSCRRRCRTLHLSVNVAVYISTCVCVRVCVSAPYTSEEEDDDVNPREKKQVGCCAAAAAAAHAPSTLMT